MSRHDGRRTIGAGRARAGPRRLSVDPGVLASAVVVVVVLAVLVEMLRVGAGVSGPELTASWQLLDRDVLEHDLVRGLWYSHTQPPLHNAMVGLVLSSPLPAEGTLFVLYGACLVAIGLLLQDLARRWGVPRVAACVLACLAVANPSLLATIPVVSYEVPLAAMLLGLVWALDRHLASPTARGVAAVVALGTAVVLTRALFHPLWLAVLLVLVVVARPLGRTTAVAAVAVPVVAIGGLVAKNALLVERATLSTWSGFNLQRGIVAPMRAEDVAAAIEDGAVTSLAATPPWQELGAYRQWTGTCAAAHDHPVLAAPHKASGDISVPNFNHQCYLDLYADSRDHAITMLRRHPGRYLSTRVDALTLSFSFTTVGVHPSAPTFFGEDRRRRAWMDEMYEPLALLQDASIDMRDWNVPLFGDRLTVRVSWTLIALATAVTARTALAAARLARVAAARRGPWPPGEVVRIVAGGTVVFAIGGGDLVELGENGRFRSMLDPLVLVLAAGAVVEIVGAARARRTVAPAADAEDRLDTEPPTTV